VERIRDRLDAAGDEVDRRERIDRVSQGAVRIAPAQINRNDLADCVNAPVRPTGKHRPAGASRKPVEEPFKLVLDGALTRL
jgi:hypothetical protein